MARKKFKAPLGKNGYPCARCAKGHKLCYQHRARTAQLKKKRGRKAKTGTYERQQQEKRESMSRFLKTFAKLGNVTMACEQTNVGRRTHYEWLTDPEYAAAFEAAKDEATERLEFEARRRATVGVGNPVFHNGVEVGTTRRYSDTLLIFLLKALKPEKYRERFDHRLSGKDGGPIETKGSIDPTRLSDETLDALAEEAGLGDEPLVQKA